MFENIQPFHLLESSAACSVRGSEVLKLLPAPRHSALGKASAPGNLYDGLINMHAECHFNLYAECYFNLRASANCMQFMSAICLLSFWPCTTDCIDHPYYSGSHSHVTKRSGSMLSIHHWAMRIELSFCMVSRVRRLKSCGGGISSGGGISCRHCSTTL